MHVSLQAFPPIGAQIIVVYALPTLKIARAWKPLLPNSGVRVFVFLTIGWKPWWLHALRKGHNQAILYSRRWEKKA
jgi:hypothetical protein